MLQDASASVHLRVSPYKKHCIADGTSRTGTRPCSCSCSCSCCRRIVGSVYPVSSSVFLARVATSVPLLVARLLFHSTADPPRAAFDVSQSSALFELFRHLLCYFGNSQYREESIHTYARSIIFIATRKSEIGSLKIRIENKRSIFSAYNFATFRFAGTKLRESKYRFTITVKS